MVYLAKLVFSHLYREERESPEVWLGICIEKLAELANESITTRRVLEPMFAYFDQGRHWASRNGFALMVLCDIAHLGKNSGNASMPFFFLLLLLLLLLFLFNCCHKYIVCNFIEN